MKESDSMESSGVDSGLADALRESARLLRQNRPGEAATRLLPFFHLHPAVADVAINLSGAYILQRKWERAARVLRTAVEANPHNAMLWANLGAAELGVLETSGPQQQERAITAYENALKADAGAPNVHYHLALIYKERGDLTRAAAFFLRALEVDPKDRDARNWLAQLDVGAAGQEADGASRAAGQKPGTLAGADEAANN